MASMAMKGFAAQGESVLKASEKELFIPGNHHPIKLD
jgi:hypothetical protein